MSSSATTGIMSSSEMVLWHKRPERFRSTSLSSDSASSSNTVVSRDKQPLARSSWSNSNSEMPCSVSSPNTFLRDERQDSHSNSVEAELVSLMERLKLSDDDYDIDRIKRIASRFGISHWMFSEDGKLLSPGTDPNQRNTWGTRTALISDIISWIFNPHRTAYILEIIGYDTYEVLGTVHEASKGFDIPAVLMAFYDPEFPPELILLCIALMVATLEKEFAEFLESQTSHFKRETLPNPHSLFKLLFTPFYALQTQKAALIVMINASWLEAASVIMEAISETQIDCPLPILWILSRESTKPLPLEHPLVISMVAPPFTDAEKETILREIHESRWGDIQEWIQGEETLLVPFDVIDSSTKYVILDPELEPEGGMQIPWSEDAYQHIDTAVHYLDCYRSLGLTLNQNREESINSFDHPVGGQYRQLVLPAHDGSLGSDQFILVMVSIENRIYPRWTELAYGFFLGAFDIFKTGTLDFAELTHADNFFNLFEEHLPGQGDLLTLRVNPLAVINYLDERFQHFILPIRDRAVIPPLMFGYLSALGSRTIDRLLFATTYFNFETLDYRSSLVCIYRDIHKDLWKLLTTITFWDDPDFRDHFSSVLPLMRFHTHSIPVASFLGFVFFYRKYEVSTGFVRVEVSSSLDRDLINACGLMARALDFEAESAQEFAKFLYDGEARYALLGFPTDPVLCIIVAEAVTLYTHAELAELL